MAHCLIGLGSNLGERVSLLRSAWEHIGQLPQTRTLRLSPLTETAPAGGPTGQAPFLNAAGVLETELAPEELLDGLLDLEQSLGRVRHERWGPRTIDIDLLLYGDMQLETSRLTLPHPRMAFRRFVLEPAVKIASDFVYPINGWSIARLLEHVRAASNVISLVATQPKLVEQALAIVGSSPERTAGFRILDRWPAEGSLDRGDAKETVLATDDAVKLAIVVEDSTPTTPEIDERLANWRNLRTRSDVGPVLWLRTDDPQRVAEEVFGAIEAMR